MPRKTFTSGAPGFVADIGAMQIQGGGAQIKWSAFTNARYGTAGTRKIPAGEPVSWEAATGQLIPSDGTAKTGLLITDAYEDSQNAALTGYGVYVGGPVYLAALPVVPAAAVKTQLDKQFIFQ